MPDLNSNRLDTTYIKSIVDNLGGNGNEYIKTLNKNISAGGESKELALQKVDKLMTSFGAKYNLESGKVPIKYVTNATTPTEGLTTELPNEQNNGDVSNILNGIYNAGIASIGKGLAELPSIAQHAYAKAYTAVNPDATPEQKEKAKTAIGFLLRGPIGGFVDNDSIDKFSDGLSKWIDENMTLYVDPISKKGGFTYDPKTDKFGFDWEIGAGTWGELIGGVASFLLPANIGSKVAGASKIAKIYQAAQAADAAGDIAKAAKLMAQAQAAAKDVSFVSKAFGFLGGTMAQTSSMMQQARDNGLLDNEDDRDTVSALVATVSPIISMIDMMSGAEAAIGKQTINKLAGEAMIEAVKKVGVEGITRSTFQDAVQSSSKTFLQKLTAAIKQAPKEAGKSFSEEGFTEAIQGGLEMFSYEIYDKFYAGKKNRPGYGIDLFKESEYEVPGVGKVKIPFNKESFAEVLNQGFLGGLAGGVMGPLNIAKPSEEQQETLYHWVNMQAKNGMAPDQILKTVSGAIEKETYFAERSKANPAKTNGEIALENINEIIQSIVSFDKIGTINNPDSKFQIYKMSKMKSEISGKIAEFENGLSQIDAEIQRVKNETPEDIATLDALQVSKLAYEQRRPEIDMLNQRIQTIDESYQKIAATGQPDYDFEMRYNTLIDSQAESMPETTENDNGVPSAADAQREIGARLTGNPGTPEELQPTELPPANHGSPAQMSPESTIKPDMSIPAEKTDTPTPESAGEKKQVDPYGLEKLQYTMHDADKNEIVFVDTDKILEKHAQDQPDYDITQKKNQIGNRVGNAEKYLSDYATGDNRLFNPKTGNRTNNKATFSPSIVQFNGDKISFQDGRHRILSAKNMGFKTVAVEVPKNQVQRFKDELGVNASPTAATSSTTFTQLLTINKNVFGLATDQAFKAAQVMYRIVKTMSQRAGVGVDEMFKTLKFEKSNEEFVKGLTDKGKVLWQIVGENAKLQDEIKDNLVTANEMEASGKTPLKIKKATGWEKGADGKWKYELPDAIMHNLNNTWIKQRINSFSNILAGSLFDTLITKKEDDIFSMYGDALYNIKVRISTVMQKGESYNGSFIKNGKYDIGSIDIRVPENTDIFSPESQEKIKSILLHELQHAIQEIEGFAKGGNLEMFSKDKFYSLTYEQSYEQYKKLAGEVEARNVQTRMYMSPEQRRKTLLSSTEDIGRDEQIILFDSNGIKAQIEAWHGSPYIFDKFSTQKIGTGEGSQAFGWGLYFTDLESIARGYADKLSKYKIKIGNKELSIKDVEDITGWKSWEHGDIERILGLYEDGRFDALKGLRGEGKGKEVMNYLIDNKVTIEKNKNLYKVSLHKGKTPEQYTWLEWDKPIKKEFLLNNVLAEIRKIDEKTNSLRDFQRELSSAQDDNYYKQNLLNYSGEDFYKRLSGSIGQKEASLLLLRAGIDGIKYPAESIARGTTSDTARGFNYVVFDENAVSVEEVIRFQQDAELARGAVMIGMDGQAVIYALTNPNVSTPLHEMAHVFEHYLTDEERAIVNASAGTSSWTTETSEYFARGFEKYLSEGISPSPELQTVFDKFAQWLTEIYREITGSPIDVELNDAMRDIYAKMLGAELAQATQEVKVPLGEKYIYNKNGDVVLAQIIEQNITTTTFQFPNGDIQKVQNDEVFETRIEAERYKERNSDWGSIEYKTNSDKHIIGREITKTIPDGSKITGVYKVVPATELLPSHNHNTFAKSENFPTVNGKTVNDRDYENDTAAQAAVRNIAQNLNDAAIQNTPVVTSDGIVIDGNNRTMSRKLAAEIKTDSEYVSYLKANAPFYGLNAADIDNIENPTLIIELYGKVPYTTQTFSAFNAAEKKEKSPIEKAVELSKTMSDRARRILTTIYEGTSVPSDVTSSPKKMAEVRNLLLSEKILRPIELPRYIDTDSGVATRDGVSFLETLLLGSALSENTIRILDSDGMGGIKNILISAVVPLTQNASLGPNSLQQNIQFAISLVNNAKKSNTNVLSFFSQIDMFDAVRYTPADLAIALILENGGGFGKFLKTYNETVNTTSLFEETENGIITKGAIIDNFLQQKLTNYEQIRKNLLSDAERSATEFPENYGSSRAESTTGTGGAPGQTAGQGAAEAIEATAKALEKLSAEEISKIKYPRKAIPTHDMIAVEHAGYEAPRRVTSANKNEIQIQGYGTTPTTSFLSRLIENGRLNRADFKKGLNIRLSEEYATELLRENEDLFPSDLAEPKAISEAYHKAKADGSNRELVEAVEELLGKPTEKQKTENTDGKENTSAPITKDSKEIISKIAELEKEKKEAILAAKKKGVSELKTKEFFKNSYVKSVIKKQPVGTVFTTTIEGRDRGDDFIAWKKDAFIKISENEVQGLENNNIYSLNDPTSFVKKRDIEIKDGNITTIDEISSKYDAKIDELKKQYTEQPATQEEIVKAALSTGEKSIKEIAEQTGILEPNIRRILGTGTKAGKFERVGKGVYVLKSENGKQTAWIEAGDAKPTLARMAEEGMKFDMVFLDPAYFSKALIGGNRGIKKYDFITPEDFSGVMKSVSALVDDDNHVYLMLSGARTAQNDMVKYVDGVIDAGFKLIGEGGYQKLFSDGSPVTNVRGEVAAPERLMLFTKSGEARPGEVPVNLNFRFLRPSVKTSYQTEKPKELLRALIQQSTFEGESILDPFAGSGVTGEQAIETGRSVTLVEKNPEVVETIIKPRLEAAAEKTEPTPPTPKRRQRIDELNSEIGDLMDQFASIISAKKDLTEQEQASALQVGMKIIAASAKLGYYKLEDVAYTLYKRFGKEVADRLMPYVKDAYNAARGRDKENRKEYNTEEEVDEYTFEADLTEESVPTPAVITPPAEEYTPPAALEYDTQEYRSKLVAAHDLISDFKIIVQANAVPGLKIISINADKNNRIYTIQKVTSQGYTAIRENGGPFSDGKPEQMYYGRDEVPYEQYQNAKAVGINDADFKIIRTATRYSKSWHNSSIRDIALNDPTLAERYTELSNFFEPLTEQEYEEQQSTAGEQQSTTDKVAAITAEATAAIQEADNAKSIGEHEAALQSIDSSLAQISELFGELELKGEYEPLPSDQERENPHIYIEREFKKDLTKFSKALAKALGWEHDTDKKGKLVYATANIAPAGGDGTIILWAPNSNIGVYLSPNIDPTEYTNWYEKYKLNDSIMWRFTTKEKKYTGMSNRWVNKADFTVEKMARLIQKESISVLGKTPSIDNSTTNNQIQQSNNKANETENKSRTTGNGRTGMGGTKLDPSNQTAAPDLFSGISESGSAAPESTGKTNPVQPITGTVRTDGGDTSGRSGGTGDGGTVRVIDIETFEQAHQPAKNFTIPESADSERETFNIKSRFQDNLNAIKTLIDILKNKQTSATEQQKEYLSKYVGWGGLKVIRNRENTQWSQSDISLKPLVDELNALIPELEKLTGQKNLLQSFISSTQNAHYTALPIIRSVYTALEQLGFNGGSIIEPSAGIGNFFAAMPLSMMHKSKLTGIELEPVTGNILKYLYPESNTQISPYEKAKLPSNYYDLAISNIPFGNYQVYDSEMNKLGLGSFMNRIHNYFFIRSILNVREGGLIAFITTAGVMDSKGNQDVREYIDKNTDFLGAIRLPNNTFKGNANTEVVTDVIFLRKNTTGEKKNPNINSLVSIPVKHKNTGNNTNILVNQYFIDNPENVIGEFMAGGLESRDDMTVVVDKDTNIAERMRQVIKDKFPVGIYQVAPKAASKTQKATNTTKLKSGKSKPSGSAKLITSNIQDVEDGNLFIDETDNQPYLRVEDFEDGKIPLPKNAKVEKVNGIIRIKNTLNRQYELETGDNNESEIEANRKELLSAYNDFITTFGRLNDKNNAPLIKKDINGFNILSLENVDRDTKNVVSTADIFKKRVILPKVLIESAEDINDAISISYNEFGHVNIQRVAQLLSSTPEQVMNENYGILFYDTDNSVVTRSEYLSGNVKKKLREATKAAQSNPLFEKNVEALTEVIPEDIPAAKIEVNLGVRWVPAETYADFASSHLFNTTVKVRYNSLADAYGIESYSRSNFDIDTKWAVKDKNGITRADGLKIFENALMQKPTVIYDKLDDDKSVVNKELSERAREKMELMIEEFQKWIWADIDRREKLGRLYNDINNNTVKRTHDGSLLRFDGMNADITLDPHQKDGIAMLINNVGGIIDHIVGAGKTYLMITAAIKMKQLGIVKKPLIIGLKSTIPHLKSDALKLYPTAKILKPSETDFTAQKRKQLLSKIQNNDWDLIILSHEQFQAIPQSAEFQMEITQAELNEIDETLERAERERGKSASKKELSGLETRRKNLVAKLQKLADTAKDKEILDFKRIGIDKLFVDESQQFKNLEYSTRITRVAGLGNPTGSKRSFNMLTAIRTLQHLHQGDKGTTFLSGTPISNSLVEMYLLFKYLRPSKLKEAGYNTFDAWVTQFAVQSTELESSVTGQMKMNTRFREFINLPELSMMYNEIADVRNDDNLKLEKPKMRGGKPILVVVPQSPDQLYWTDRIVEFAKQPHGSRDGSLIGKPHLTESQQSAAMLMASTLSNKLSIDIRLIDKNYDENPNGKIAAVVKNIVQEYKNSESIKGTQMIFCDTGTPKSDKMNELLKDYMEDELNISDDEISQIFGDNPETIPTITKIKEKLTTVLEWSNEEIEYHLSQAKESQGVFNVYAETKRKLIAEGIPEHEIKFIHDFKTSKAKEDLFKDFNNGTVRVLIGSTQKLGTGVNAQKRIVALHHLDAQWNPAAMEQRNGRGLRRGNINEEVAIYQYGTERTQDAYKYDLIDKKGKFISQIKSGAIGDVRSMKQEDEMDAESMTAMLSGDPLTINRIKVSKQVDKLKRSEKNFRNERFVAESKLKKTEAELPPARNSIPRMENDLSLLKQNEQRTEDGQLVISGIVNGALYDKPKELGEAINAKKKEILKRPVGHTQTIGSINGFTLTGTVSPADLAGTVFKVTLTLSNDLSYHIGESSDPVQQVLAIRRHFNSLQSRLDTKIEDINRMEQNIIKLREELDKKWDKQDEYEKAIATLKEIDDKIRQQNEEENKNTGTGNSRGNDEEFDTDVDEYTNGSDGTPGPRFQKATERINVAIANAKELAGSIKQRIADSGPEGIAAAASELATTNPYISKYIPAAATEPVDVEMGTLLDMPADERAKVVLEEMGADTVALNELSEKLFAYGMRTINQPKPLNANQALAISKILQKVFPNVQMFTNEQQYKNALAQIQKDGFQVDYVSAGFIYNGKMYINPAMVSSSTQIHELIHIFTSWAYKYSPATYSKLISVAQQAPEEVIAYIRNEYPELEYNSDRFWEEVFTTFAGEQLSERVMSAIESEQGKKWHTRVLDALKEIVSRFTAAVRNSMGIGLPELKEKDVSAMSIGEFVDYVGGKLLSGNKISDITSEDVKEIEAIRESLKDFPAGTSMLAADEMIKLAAAKELLAKGMPIRRIRTNTGWSINPKGSWEYNESHTYKEYQNEENKDLIKTQIRAQKVAKDVAQINNTPALEAIMNQIIASSAGNPQVVTDLTRIVFQEYVDTLRYEQRAKGRPYLSQAFIDVFYDDAEMEQVSNYMLNPADITLTKQQQEVFNKLFNYGNNSVLNKYKDWIEANNYTVLEQGADGDIQQKIFRLDDTANRNEILEEKEKLTSSDTDKGWLGKLFNLSVGGKKIGSIMPKNLLFRHLWNEKTIAEMLSAKGKALYEILVTSIESARKIAMPLRTVALYFEKNLLEKYSDISIYGNKTTYSQVEKMQITAKDGNVYDISLGEALSIVMSAHTQMADGYVKNDGEPGFSAIDATMKIENYKGEKDIEFSLTQEEFDRIENELLSSNFLDGKTKMLYEELKEYYNREEFIDVNGNTDTSKLSLFGAVQKVFEIDNAKKLSKSNLYFPIQTYESQRDLNRSTLANESQLLDDVSILHDRSKKVNNIIIKDAIQSLHEFNDKSLNFVEYWLPTRNIDTFVNRNGQWLRNNGMEYIVDNLEEFAKNLNNYDKLEYEANKGITNKPVKGLLSAFAVSRLSFNLFTALKQFWGYPIAMGLGIIDDKYLAKQIPEVLKEMGVSYGAFVREFQNYIAGKKVSELADIEPYKAEISKNPYAYDILYRLTNPNLYNMNDIILQSLGADKYSDSKAVGYWSKFVNFFSTVGMSQILQADAAIIIGLYKSAEAQVKETMPQLSQDEQYKEIAKLASEAMYATQQTNVLSDKTQMQLSHSVMDKLMSIFTAQSQKMINTIAQQWIRYAKEEDADLKEKYGRQFIFAANNMFIGNAMYMALVTTLAALIRGTGGGEEDDALDKKFIDNFKWNFIRELAGYIPGYAGEMGSFIVTHYDNQVWSDKFGGVDVYKGANNLFGGLLKVADSFSQEDEEEQQKKMYEGIDKAMSGLGDVTGISQEFLRQIKLKEKE